MRKIEYRVWDKEEKKFFEPTYEAYKGNLSELLLSPSGRICMRTIDKLKDESLFPDRFILQQYIGIIDPNGIKIFEGDIVKYWGGVGEVVYVEKDAAFEIKQTENDFNYFCKYEEVVGNVYETPELLK